MDFCLNCFLRPQFSRILPHYSFCGRSFLNFCLIMFFAAAVFWIPVRSQLSGFLRGRSYLDSCAAVFLKAER